MKSFKSAAVLAMSAALILALNGLVNYTLIVPLKHRPDVINDVRLHLDDAVFTLLFVFIGIVFLAMFTVLRKEKGYVYLSIFSFLTSLHLFSEWDDKTVLFGEFPELPYSSVAIKRRAKSDNLL